VNAIELFVSLGSKDVTFMDMGSVAAFLKLQRSKGTVVVAAAKMALDMLSPWCEITGCTQKQGRL
jgi:hypothetical protein